MSNKVMSGITPEVLEHALAFKGSSAELFHEVLEEVRGIMDSSGMIYPPTEFPRLGRGLPSSSLRTAPASSFDGPVSPAEAAGIKVLQTEVATLAQSFGINPELGEQINELLGTGKDRWQSDAIEAMSLFGSTVGAVAGIREKRLREEAKNAGSKTWGDIIDAKLLALFADPLEADGGVIGSNTANAIVEEIASQAREDIPANPRGARNEREIQARINGRVHGAQLARDLYLEVLQLASNTLLTELINICSDPRDTL